MTELSLTGGIWMREIRIAGDLTSQDFAFAI